MATRVRSLSLVAATRISWPVAETVMFDDLHGVERLELVEHDRPLDGGAAR